MSKLSAVNCHHGIPNGLFCGACEAEYLAAPADGIDAVLQERGKRYGEFIDHSRITQNVKNVLRDGVSWALMSFDQREAVEMIAHKLGRIVNGDPDYADSWVDIAGYAHLVSKRLEK